MKSFLLVISLILAASTHSQITIGFEEQALDSESFINDSGTEGLFSFSQAEFPNDYNADWDSFTHWSISNMTDTETAGFGNQFSAITGGGDDSENFGVCFSPSGSFIKFSETVMLENVSITNGTYPFLSMLNGDSFAKRFGGETGDDPDFFRLTVKSFLNGEVSQDSLVVSLADYTFEDNTQDFILDTWLTVDLSSFGLSDSLWFELSSTDNGDFGMNTPAYFCLDNLAYTRTNSISESESQFHTFPNPVVDVLNISEKLEQVLIYDMRGALIQSLSKDELSQQISLATLEKGIYTFQFFLNDYVISRKIVKE